MNISNSSLKTWWECPLKFQEVYINGIQRANTPSYYLFGQRLHQLLEAHYMQVSVPPTPPALSQEMELEVQAMFQAYLAAYPQEPFNVLQCERAFDLPIPDSTHRYVGKIDAIIRDKQTGALQILETKSQSRGSKRNNPRAWTARTQGSLYVWACQQIYQEPIDTIILNVCTKGSPKGQYGPSFRRDTLYRSPLQLTQAVADLQYVASQIDFLGTKDFPANRNACVSDQGWECDFWSAHNIGWDEGTRSEFVHIDPYSYLTL